MPPKRRTHPSQKYARKPILDCDLEPDTDAPTKPLTLAPPPLRSNTELNHTVLRRYVPSITQILSIAPFAVLYTFLPETQIWEKCGVEGTLFMCQLANSRSHQHIGVGYNVLVLNRKSLENFEVELVTAANVEITPEYVILHAIGEGGTVRTGFPVRQRQYSIYDGCIL
ncbi:hypothetical protein LTS16_026668 [Friedmanniomyces endolithicus]|nr:hypothetical protein LTS16_026668 [Friedmanniomyces endolithicus]